MSKFLDQAGLSYFWQKLSTLLSGKLGTSETAHKTASIPMGQVDSTSTAKAFTATVDGITELRDGICMWLMNGVVTSTSGFTININNLGAKPVYSSLAAASRSTTIFNIDYTMLFVYNETRVSGGCWDIVYGYDSDTDTIGYQVRHNSKTGNASAKTSGYRLLFTGDEDTLVPANTSTSMNIIATKAVNQTPIDPFGPIYYYGAATTINAGSLFGDASLWQQQAIKLGYSFNTTVGELTLSYPKAVYIKAAPTSDGKAIIDAGTPYVQTLPTTADGKIYIYLGQAYSATNVELDLHHPVYEYKNGKIQLYTGNEIPTATVQDGSLTEAKFSDGLKLKTIKDYVTPEMFGAKGDGVTDDTTALQSAVDSGKDVFLSQGTYLIGGTVVIQNDVVLFGCGFNSVLKITGKITTDNAKHNINLHDFTVFASKSNGNAVEIIATNNALADNTLNITGVYFEFDNTVTNSTATMLYLYGVRESMISNCVFFGSDYHYPSGSIGLKAEADSTHLTMNINISGCAFSYLGDAIYLNGSEGNRIYLAGFRIINNTIIGCGYGVRTYYFDTPMISNNMIDYCEYPIYCESSTGITIDNNYIQTAHSGGCLYIINTSSAACDIINIFDNIIHSSNGSTAGSEITDGIVLEGGTSPVILRHVNIKGNFIFRVKTAINLANTQFANISNNQVFYATTFVDGNNSSDYTKLFDNYVQSDVSYFCANKKDTWKITDNQWGSSHTNGTLRGTLGFSVAANSSAEYNVSFNGLGCVFYDVPAVNVYFNDVGTSWQDMFIAITSVSTSGFTFKIVNASGTAHSNVVRWSAILA